MKIPEKVYIQATDYPDPDYIINQLLVLSSAVNEVIDYLESQEKKKR